MDMSSLIKLFDHEFSGGRFNPDYVNDSAYLKSYRLHSRICGIIGKIGVRLGYTVDCGRKFPIDPIKKANGRYQRQAEADISFIETTTDEPIALFDYETSDAPIGKIESKFNYLRTFRKNTNSLELISLIVTITAVQHNWRNNDRTKETNEERQQFANSRLIALSKATSADQNNKEMEFLLGIFRAHFLELLLFHNGENVNKIKILYHK